MPIKLEAYKDYCNRTKTIFQFCFLPPCLLPPSVSVAPQPQSLVAFWAHCSLSIFHACLVCSCFSLSRMPFLTLSTWKVSVLSSRPGIMSLASGCHYRPYCFPACLLLCLPSCGSQWNPLLAYWCPLSHQLLVSNPRPGSGPPCSGLKDAFFMNKGGNLTCEIYGGQFPNCQSSNRKSPHILMAWLLCGPVVSSESFRGYLVYIMLVIDLPICNLSFHFCGF